MGLDLTTTGYMSSLLDLAELLRGGAERSSNVAGYSCPRRYFRRCIIGDIAICWNLVGVSVARGLP